MAKASGSAPKSIQFDADAINQIVEEEIQLRRTGNVSEIQGRSAKAGEVYSAWEQDRSSVDFIVSSLTHTDLLTTKMVRPKDFIGPRKSLFCADVSYFALFWLILGRYLKNLR